MPPTNSEESINKISATTLGQYKTLSFSILKDKKENVLERIMALIKGSDWLIKEDELNFQQIYYPFPPHGALHKRKILLWSPFQSPLSTGFFSNLEDGWNTLVFNVSKKFNIETFRIIMSDESIERLIYLFEYQNGQSNRLIRSMMDERWRFDERGERLWFEDLNNYKKRKIQDRMNASIIISYLKAAGWNIELDDFWSSNEKGIYIIEK